jgi:hypothetical protein
MTTKRRKTGKEKAKKLATKSLSSNRADNVKGGACE